MEKKQNDIELKLTLKEAEMLLAATFDYHIEIDKVKNKNLYQLKWAEQSLDLSQKIDREITAQKTKNQTDKLNSWLEGPMFSDQVQQISDQCSNSCECGDRIKLFVEKSLRNGDVPMEMLKQVGDFTKPDYTKIGLYWFNGAG